LSPRTGTPWFDSNVAAVCRAVALLFVHHHSHVDSAFAGGEQSASAIGFDVNE
jgi:hypothetical protein